MPQTPLAVFAMQTMPDCILPYNIPFPSAAGRPYPAMGAALPDRNNKITYDILHVMTQRMCLAAAVLLCMKLLDRKSVV